MDVEGTASWLLVGATESRVFQKSSIIYGRDDWMRHGTGTSQQSMSVEIGNCRCGRHSDCDFDTSRGSSCSLEASSRRFRGIAAPQEIRDGNVDASAERLIESLSH